MSALIDLVGERFGRLTVIARAADPGRPGATRWRCSCDCGGESVAQSWDLRRGRTRSCGCRQGAHGLGHAATSAYGSWRAMKKRCYYVNGDKYAYYGGRGIEVCTRWRDDFQAFLADMGERPDGHTLDRIDADGNYEPGNCRWATAREQRRNRRDSREVTP